MHLTHCCDRQRILYYVLSGLTTKTTGRQQKLYRSWIANINVYGSKDLLGLKISRFHNFIISSVHRRLRKLMRIHSRNSFTGKPTT